MILFPAIDILDKKAVRLYKGERLQATEYGTPLEMAEKWVSMGAEFLHLVDLNAAFDNSDVNGQIIREIANKVNVPLQVGGGMRTMQKVKKYLETYNVNRVIIGTAAVTNENFFYNATKEYGDRIVAGIDVKDGKVAIKGWVDSVDMTAKELALKARDLGVNTIVYTDISRDGALCGVNVADTMRLSIETKMHIIASGGVKDISDIGRLKIANIYGCILGKALYENTIDLQEAIKEAKG